MKTLYLLRHGKSSWGNPGEGDFNRPLKKRGIENAQLMGRHMASSAMRPDFVLCSAATRAQQTFSCYQEGFGEKLDNRIEETLYLADPKMIVSHLASIPDHIQSVLVVGHNPGLQYLALDLSAETSENSDRLEEKFPTAALAVLTVENPSWSPIEARSFTLQDYLTPKILQA
jgi:phosphohistidine phosphatase